jgi:AbrB family looped-hinge helix DNA binding protein
MRTTIDSAGRIVVPKALRDELGLRGGEELEIAAADGNLEISVPTTPIRMVRRDGILVAEPLHGKLPTLSAEQVRDALERVRR